MNAGDAESFSLRNRPGGRAKVDPVRRVCHRRSTCDERRHVDEKQVPPAVVVATHEVGRL